MIWSVPSVNLMIQNSKTRMTRPSFELLKTRMVIEVEDVVGTTEVEEIIAEGAVRLVAALDLGQDLLQGEGQTAGAQREAEARVQEIIVQVGAILPEQILQVAVNPHLTVLPASKEIRPPFQRNFQVESTVVNSSSSSTFSGFMAAPMSRCSFVIHARFEALALFIKSD